MDDRLFDRITRSLADSAPRRAAFRAAAGATLAAAISNVSFIADAKKKKRCRKVGQTCGSSSRKGRRKCCNKSGLVRCEQFPTFTCEDLSGFYCCGTVGSECDPNFGTPFNPNEAGARGNCSCCDPLFCGPQLDGKFRCQTEEV